MCPASARTCQVNVSPSQHSSLPPLPFPPRLLATSPHRVCELHALQSGRQLRSWRGIGRRQPGQRGGALRRRVGPGAVAATGQVFLSPQRPAMRLRRTAWVAPGVLAWTGGPGRNVSARDGVPPRSAGAPPCPGPKLCRAGPGCYGRSPGGQDGQPCLGKQPLAQPRFQNLRAGTGWDHQCLVHDHPSWFLGLEMNGSLCPSTGVATHGGVRGREPGSGGEVWIDLAGLSSLFWAPGTDRVRVPVRTRHRIDRLLSRAANRTPKIFVRHASWARQTGRAGVQPLVPGPNPPRTPQSDPGCGLLRT